MEGVAIFIVAIGLVVSIPWRRTLVSGGRRNQAKRIRAAQRAVADYELRAITGDLTPAELQKVVDEENAVRDRVNKTMYCFNNPQHTWIDHAGNVRDMDTDEIVRYAK